MFDILWEESATNELTSIWLAASSEDRARVTAATRDIDRTLLRNPVEAGESRPDGVRILHVLPLCILFDIDLNRRAVRVLQVWHVSRRRR
jgi:ParE toxin of type II toxin-antitoxin system, parDE